MLRRSFAVFLCLGWLHAVPLPRVTVSPDRGHFVLAGSDQRFVPWGFNYDHDATGRLIEDYWRDEWPTIEEDFREMKTLGANVVRIHLQLGKFMRTPDEPDPAALERLKLLLQLAEEAGLYLNLTGLGCYHAKDVPGWYDPLPEAERWAVQARFWKAVASVANAHSQVFCYDLMNEPVAPSKKETGWLAGELDGKYYIQRITLDPAGRDPKTIAREWVKQLTGAIREVDRTTMITVGVVPWSMFFPEAQPVFHSKEAGGPLDFASIHVYPERGKFDAALQAIALHDAGKPVLIEEIFPLKCNPAELERFVEASRERADGWLGFYWGKEPAAPSDKDTIRDSLIRGWLDYFRRQAPRMKAGQR